MVRISTLIAALCLLLTASCGITEDHSPTNTYIALRSDNNNPLYEWGPEHMVWSPAKDESARLHRLYTVVRGETLVKWGYDPTQFTSRAHFMNKKAAAADEFL